MACSAMSMKFFLLITLKKWDRGVELWRKVIGKTVKRRVVYRENGKRDLWPKWGIAPAAYAAEIGRIQGLDLYAEWNKRIQGAVKAAGVGKW